MVLTRVLGKKPQPAPRLRRCQTQVSIETDNRSRMQPDVIMRLPREAGRGDRRQNDPGRL